jgi:hypothetical protein
MGRSPRMEPLLYHALRTKIQPAHGDRKSTIAQRVFGTGRHAAARPQRRWLSRVVIASGNTSELQRKAGGEAEMVETG